MDTTLSLLINIKNNWSLSGTSLTGSAIAFTTSWFNEETMLPQITITQVDDINEPTEIGALPNYFISNTYFVDIWVRPISDSGTSYGAAKNNIYNMRKEVKRIIRALGNIGTTALPEYPFFAGYRNLNETKTRPVLFRTNIVVRTFKYRNYNEE